MGKKPDRRKFIKELGIGGLSAVPIAIGMPASFFSLEKKELALPANADRESENIPASRAYNESYTGEFLNRVAFPIGGIGAGMFCLDGVGSISHMSVRNKPEMFNEPALFAGIFLKGIQRGAKLLEGPVPNWKKFGQEGSGYGSGGATTGLPRFQKISTIPRFPFSYIDLSDHDIPLRVQITGWSPFIPTDDDNSSLPAGAIEYKLTNTGKTELDAVFSYNAKNFLRIDKGKDHIAPITNGFVLTEDGLKEKPLRSEFAIFTDDAATVVDHCWFRGGWWDPFTMAWNAIKNGEVKTVAPVESGAPGASLYVPFRLAPGKEKTIRVMMTWYTPESDINIGKVVIKENCDPATGCCASPDVLDLDKYDKNFDGKVYQPWYASRFKSIVEVSDYWKKNYSDLRSKSLLFENAFFASTLPPEVIEAVAANLSILKSPTVLRQYDGRLWNWEGCGETGGCCHGSCTHVWNYAQAIPHLFPALERSLRHTEFCESQSVEGHQNFRSNLPITPTSHEFHAAADGQLGGIMKAYREWRISGNNDWLKKMYPMVKASMDYCIKTWDPRHKGAIEEPHHNTYDIEFWGPDGMHSSFYVGALNAIILMGKFLGKDVALYEELSAKGKKFMETEIYDGEYFYQKIQVTGLNAPNPAEDTKSFGGKYSDEAKKLLEKEGPKYQYGKGCLSDGVLGAWIARMCGMPDPIDEKKLKSHLLAVHKYNLKDNLSDHANPQRPGYALGDEGGLLLCTWPKGGKLSLPFVYSDEVWTGIEHQVAAHLMIMGHVKEGLDVVKLSRNRYDGRIRNPFNEYECGHWYARALASYGYLQCLTGVRYDAVDKTLFIDSKIGDFTSFLSTESGFGTVSLKQGKPSVKVVYGKIEVEKFNVSPKASQTIKSTT